MYRRILLKFVELAYIEELAKSRVVVWLRYGTSVYGASPSATLAPSALCLRYTLPPPATS